MRLFLVCMVAATAVVAATATPAHACSCAVPDPRTLLTETDGAFVGRLVSRRDLGDGRAVFTFRVEQSVKGALGRTVDVESASNGAACGLETPVGARIGLFLDRRGGRWTSSLCWQVSPDDLLAAAQPLPPPDGRGPVTVLVGGRFGTVRTLALDMRGRALAYGRGAGVVLHLSACPGARRMAEVIYLDNRVVMAVRELPGLRLVRQRPVAAPPGTAVTALRCEGPDAGRLLLFHASPDRPATARLERVAGSQRTVLWRGSAVGATLTARTAFVTAGAHGTRLLAVDLATRHVRVLGRIPQPASALVAGPGGRELAGLAATRGSAMSLVRIRVTPFAVVRKPIVESGELSFLDARRLLLLASGGRRARIYTPSLDVASSFRWTAYRSTVAGTTAYGVGFRGRLHRAPLPSGPERVTRRLPGPNVSVIAPAR
jgi:hypothetical protein